MYELEELDRYEIKDRGTAICVKNPNLPELWNPGTLVGKMVRIGGEVYSVRAVETFAIFRSETSPYTFDFALLI